MIATPEEFRRIEELERENERYRKAIAFAVEAFDIGGNGEGWTMAQVIERLRSALTEEQNT